MARCIHRCLTVFIPAALAARCDDQAVRARAGRSPVTRSLGWVLLSLGCTVALAGYTGFALVGGKHDRGPVRLVAAVIVAATVSVAIVAVHVMAIAVGGKRLPADGLDVRSAAAP